MGSKTDHIGDDPDRGVRIAATTFDVIDGVTGKLTMRVSVSETVMGRTQVTQREYRDVTGRNPSHYTGDNRPVESVSWWDAIRYCNLRSLREGVDPCYDLHTGGCDFSKNGYRLPTAAEWDVAASDDFAATFTPLKANVSPEGTKSREGLLKLLRGGATSDVGSFAPNARGLYDMAGNVWEWCYDYYNEAVGIPTPGLQDPIGPSWGLERVIRGGSFLSSPELHLAKGYFRNRSLHPNSRSRFTGFRICRSGPRGAGEEAKVYPADWFDKYTRVPEDREGLGKVPSLLVGTGGRTAATATEWEASREEIRNRWLQRLGIPPKPPRAPGVEMARAYEEEIYRAEIIYLKWAPDVWLKMMLVVPKDRAQRPVPAVIVPWYDVDGTVGKNLGGSFGRSASELKNFAYLMVRVGYVVAALKFHMQIEESPEEAMAYHLLRYPDSCGLGRFVWDVQRVIDYLLQRPEVDGSRIGTIGHCAGGINTIFSAAFEDRIQVAVSCGSAVSVRYSNYDDYWYLGEENCSVIDKGTDLQEVLALVAPRPFLLNLVTGNYVDESWPYVNAAREIYALHGKAHYLGYIHDAEAARGEISPWAVDHMRDWLVRFLG